tara:strand:+ start:751 stop:966 length:216 start_codon:yes stop_codon:yes gene_type:complete
MKHLLESSNRIYRGHNINIRARYESIYYFTAESIITNLNRTLNGVSFTHDKALDEAKKQVDKELDIILNKG